MRRRTRRAGAAVAAAAAVAAVAAPVAGAEITHQLDVAAELVRQPPGRPWEVNLLLGSTIDETSGEQPAPVNNMKFQFTRGAKVNSDAFKTCTVETLRKTGPSACPAGSLLGTGAAKAEALTLLLDADLRVYNGPGTVNDRQLIVWAKVRQIPTIVLVFPGKLKKTAGRYGWTLDLPIPPIPTVGEGNDASVTGFAVKVGGYGRKNGRKVPFIEAPTSCTRPGWPFAAQFSYAGGATSSATALMDCTIRALPGK
jgi:hypothetical protein